jgi:hypothetical protein
MKPTIPEEMDLLFLRDLKHRLRMMLREVTKREKLLLKEIKFVKGKRVPTQEQVKKSLEFYQVLHDREKV